MEALTEPTHLLRLALKTARLGTWELDFKTGRLECSAQCRENFGLTADELFTYDALRALIFPEDRPAMQNAVECALRDGSDYEAEYRISRKNGGFAWILASGRGVYNQQGEAVRMIGITLDITRRKQAQEEQQRNEEHLNMALAAGGGVGVWDWDVANNRVHTDPRFAKMYSVDPERATTGIPVEEFLNAIHPQDRGQVSHAIDESVKTGGMYAEEYRLIQKSGEVRWVEARGRCHLDERGVPMRFSGVVFDITERKQAETLLLESQERLRAMLDGTSEFFGLLDTQGRLLEANRASLEFTGHTREELLGRPFWNTPWFEFTPGLPHRIQDSVMRASSGEFLRFEILVRRSSGEERWLDFSLYPIRDVAGDLVLIVPEGRDISELKSVERRDAFLVRLEDQIRGLEEPAEIERTIDALVEKHFGAEHCRYFESPRDAEWLASLGLSWERDLVTDLTADFPLFSTVLPSAVERDGVESLGELVYLSIAPVQREGERGAGIAVLSRAPRTWSPGEVDLLRTSALRCFEAVDRARTAQALRKSERRLRLSQKAGKIGSFDWNIGSNQIEWSPELEQLYGVPVGTFEGRFEDWTKRVHPEDAERVVGQLQGAMARKEEECAYEFRVLQPAGETRWLRGQAQFFYDSADQPERMLGVNIDIDDRKRAEEHLKQQWHKFDTALSNIPDFTYNMDLQGRFTYANRALLNLYQLPIEEVVGKTFLELNHPAELAERLESQIRQAIETRQPVESATPFAGPTGETRQYEYIFVPVIGTDGAVEGVAGSTRDVTERRQREEQEREREEQLRESARLESLGLMAGGVAHDFNNLLTGILGNACLVADGTTGLPHELTNQIILAAERAADLTRQMLAFSGKGRFQTETVNLNQLVKENLTLLRASLSRTVTVQLELNPAGCPVEADRSQMQQVVMNLLINASEAVGERPGQVTVRTAFTSRVVSQFSPFLQAPVAPGRYVLLEIRDNGGGMTPETLSKIFDPFFTTKFTGRGLGLAAVLGIVKGHQGDIEVVTQPGVGTTFRVLLPLSERAVEPAGHDEQAAAFASGGQTVLVVDDEEIVQRLAATALKRHGYNVLIAGNGQDALDVLQNNGSVALVILDLTMPVLTGEQTIPLIKTLYPKLPIVLSSGYNEAEVARRFASSGIAAFLQKPYTVSAILARVTSVLDQAVPAP